MTDPKNVLDELIEGERAELAASAPSEGGGWAALQGRLAEGAAPVVDVPPIQVGSSAAGLGRWGVGLGILGLLGLALGVTVMGPDPETRPGPETAPLPVVSTPVDEPAQAPRAPAPREVEPPVAEAASPPPAPEAEPIEPTAVPAVKSGTPAQESARTLEDELELLERARVALNGGDAAGALKILGRHAREFPRGMFVEERKAMRVEALCSAGRAKEGARARERFLKTHPSSPFVDRVRGACR